MSAYIVGGYSHQDLMNRVTHYPHANLAIGPLGSWSLQRLPHQRGCWYVDLHIRGMLVMGRAVQDDFGDLQMVAV